MERRMTFSWGFLTRFYRRPGLSATAGYTSDIFKRMNPQTLVKSIVAPLCVLKVSRLQMRKPTCLHASALGVSQNAIIGFASAAFLKLKASHCSVMLIFCPQGNENQWLKLKVNKGTDKFHTLAKTSQGISAHRCSYPFTHTHTHSLWLIKTLDFN